MKLQTSLKNSLCKLLVAAAALAGAACAHAGLAIPYTPNVNTLHLWHMDDTNGVFAYDSASLDTNASPITLTNIGEPSPGTGPYTNSSVGTVASFPGLGNCENAITKQHLLYGGAYPSVAQFCNPTTGAFTFEAALLYNSSLASIDAEILAGDNGLGIGNRGWQWRLINPGAMEWDLLAGSTDNDFKATLPSSGNNAVSTNTWYHVAVTFTGQSPTNGDPTNVLTFYWTLLDSSRTHADVLAVFTNAATSPTGIRPLNGAPEGTTEPSLGIGGSARNTGANPGNNEGLIGSLDEVRVSDLCLTSNEMAFVTGGGGPPKVLKNPPPTILAGYGQPLVISPSTSLPLPGQYLWYQNGTNVPSQTGSTLIVSNATFADAGAYYLLLTNSYGTATTTVSQVTIGAVASELYSTGIVSNQVSSGDVPDPHYYMIQSSDPTALGPQEMIFEWNNPIEFAVNNGGYAPTNGASEWISPRGNPGGVLGTDPGGNYTIRTEFLLDQMSPTNVAFQCGFECNGVLTNLLLNGMSTGLTIAPGAPLYATAFTLSNYNGILSVTAGGPTIASQAFSVTNASNFFVPGINTLDFVINQGSGAAAIRVDSPTSIGQALPPGLPTITQNPASVTVRDANITGPGSTADFSVVALGCPPLSYQWYSNGFVLPGATNRALTYTNPAAGAQGTNFQVVVANASGSVTSTVASLKLVGTNQNPIVPNNTNYVYENQTLTYDISTIYAEASSPDGDALSLAAYDTSTTNGVSFTFVTSTLFTYTPNLNFVGLDTWTYTITDSQGDSVVGTNFIHVIPVSVPSVVNSTLSGGNLTLSGSGGAPGGSYMILGSSSLLNPVSTWSTVATGTFDSSGNFSLSLPINTGSSSGFYTMAIPSNQ